MIECGHYRQQKLEMKQIHYTLVFQWTHWAIAWRFSKHYCIRLTQEHLVITFNEVV